MRTVESLKKGRNSIKMIILTILSQGDCYGYQLSQLIAQYSDQKLVIPEGSLYPALYSMEEEGYVSTTKRLVGKRMERVYYHIEESGRAYLQQIEDEYRYMNAVIDQILDRASKDEERE